MQFDVRVVQHQVLGHERLKLVPINDIEFRVALQARHQVSNALLILLPVLLVPLHFQLGFGQLLVELFEVFFGLEDFVVRGDLRQGLAHDFVEAGGFFD